MIYFVLLCVTAVVSAKKAPSYDLREGSQHFENFIDTHNKVYKSDEEKAMRYEIFLKNLKKINHLNAKYEYTEYGVNQFSDLTHQEFKEQTKCLDAPAKYLGSCSSVSSGMKNKYKGSRSPIHNNMSIPTEFDWREKNVVTRVKNQGRCGSCWAFSVVGNIESINAIHTGNLIELSEQQLVDCDTSDSGCSGGIPEIAFEYFISNGVMTSDSYPYEAARQDCKYQGNSVAVRVSGCQSVSTDEEVMAQQLVALGPLSVSIDATRLQHYNGGVVTGDNCQFANLDHAVLLVGYGEDSTSGKPYWLVKNSWGESWGEQGYFRLERGVNCQDIAGSSPLTAQIN